LVVGYVFNTALLFSKTPFSLLEIETDTPYFYRFELWGWSWLYLVISMLIELFLELPTRFYYRILEIFGLRKREVQLADM
jgi:hypothetical protein